VARRGNGAHRAELKLSLRAERSNPSRSLRVQLEIRLRTHCIAAIRDIASQQSVIGESARNFYKELLSDSDVFYWVDEGARKSVMLSTILIIVLILLLIGALPTWPYSAGWGFYPGGGLGLVLIIVVVLALAGRI
jgi:hypothetical protein